MSASYREYLRLVDALREARRVEQEQLDQAREREVLGRLTDLFEQLSEDEQDLANAEGWRSWPDLYDARVLRFEVGVGDLDQG